MKEPKKNVNSLAKSLKKAKNKLKNAKQNTKNFATVNLYSIYFNLDMFYKYKQKIFFRLKKTTTKKPKQICSFCNDLLNPIKK
jgi:hypothetical protein